MWLTVSHVELVIECLSGAKDDAFPQGKGIEKTHITIRTVIKCQPAFIGATLLGLDESQMPQVSCEKEQGRGDS